MAEGLRLWLPRTGHPFCCFQGQHFASSCFSLSLLFNFFLVKILHLPCLPLTSLPLSTFTSLQSYLRSPYHFCFPDDANSFSMIPALSCLSFLTASLKALLPCFPSRSPKLLPFSSSCACVSLHTAQPLYFSLSAFYFSSPSLWLLSWPFSAATAVIHRERPVTPPPIDWASVSFALKQQSSGRQDHRKMNRA